MQWTIGKKLAGGFLLVLAIMVFTTWLASSNISQLVDTAAKVAHSQEVVATLDDIVSAAKDAETGQRGYLLTGREAYLQPYTDALGTISKKVDHARQLTADDPKQQQYLDKLETFVQAKEDELRETIELRQKQGLDAALQVVLTDRGKKAMDDLRSVIDDMEAYERELLEARQKAADATTATTRTVLVASLLVSIVLVSFIATLLTRSITGPLAELLHAVQRMEQGDLRQDRVSVASGDEVGLLAAAFNGMLVSLRDLTRQSQTAAENLNAATTQISASTRQQTTSLTEQMGAIQETTTTMEEVSRSGSQISDKAREVGANAEASSTSMVGGLQAVQNTSRIMETIREQVEVVAENIVGLSEKTQAIGDIIATVNDLAERSNLLAFNAAIEAASVGEEGSRFAVVASELKNLADQSKESTVQVRSILGDIQKGIHSSVMLTEEAVKRVESGRVQADSAEQVIRSTSIATQESVQAFQQIMAATNQQQIGFEQVSLALQNIRTASEQNAQGIGQLDTAAANMNALSSQLRKAVERFQV